MSESHSSSANNQVIFIGEENPISGGTTLPPCETMAIETLSISTMTPTRNQNSLTAERDRDTREKEQSSATDRSGHGSNYNVYGTAFERTEALA